jgi:phosphoserine aminotransferase
MKETKFNMKGLKVIKSTPWKQKSANDWSRKLMVVVTDTSSGKLNMTVIRECEKDGGFGTIKLDASS